MGWVGTPVRWYSASPEPSRLAWSAYFSARLSAQIASLVTGLNSSSTPMMECCCALNEIAKS